jgi:hypothetical protein
MNLSVKREACDGVTIMATRREGYLSALKDGVPAPDLW